MILQNKAKCKKCGQIIESKHRNDFVWCKCKSIAVDGGKDYLRRLGDPENILELSVENDKKPKEKMLDLSEEEKIRIMKKIESLVKQSSIKKELKKSKKSLENYVENNGGVELVTKKFGVTFSSVYNWLNGKNKPSRMAKKMLEGYNIDV